MLLQNISKELKNIFNLKADQENELETYVSSENKSFMQVGQLGEEYYFSGCIELDEADLEELISDLQNQLTTLQEAIALHSEPAPAIAKDWLSIYHQIQKKFQMQIVNSNSEITPQNLSLQVEIDKQLKMLGMDLSMLQTSRSQMTWQKRHQQASDRLKLLERYCQMHEPIL
jgi:hypothetical protein